MHKKTITRRTALATIGAGAAATAAGGTALAVTPDNPDAALAGLEAERERLEARAQGPMTDDERAARVDAADEAAERIAVIPVATVAGIAVKLRAASVYVDFLPDLKGEVPEGAGPQLLRSALDDAERLARGGAS